ncbi:MAG: hypothetical protein ABN482_09620 [Corticimicrobacter sp.]|uniref:hypothetical protein n=1 Tax=Corticimicrobacter sp. TaxID=2678536 RepID=UPI0032DA6982
MSEVFQLAQGIRIAEGDSYILAYPHIISYFASKDIFSEEDFVCGSHMVYGWMPTILELFPESPNIGLSQAAALLSTAKRNGKLTDTELDQLASVTNNSLVGASKLLHFVSPDNFAIWDSKIYTFLFKKKPHHYQVRLVKNYRTYHRQLRELLADSRFPFLHASVNKAVGYEVSRLRALELVMFQHSP